MGDRQVLVEELGGIGVVRMDAADAGRGHDDDLGFLLRVEVTDGRSVAKIQFPAGAQQQVVMAAGTEGSNDGRTNHAAVSGDVDLGGGIHPDFTEG